MVACAETDGVYRLSARARMFGAKARVLAGAVPGRDGSECEGSFGIVVGGLAAPRRRDAYIVRFEDDGSFRILAYIDRFARVFKTDRPLVAPPARVPDLSFARYADVAEGEQDHGAVQVRAQEGAPVVLAEYVKRSGRYSLTASWFSFEAHGREVTLDEALARAYLALVYRAELYDYELPRSGSCAPGQLVPKDSRPLPALWAIAKLAAWGEADAALCVPALVQLFACNARHANLARAIEVSPSGGADDFRLVRTVSYANTFYLGPEEACTLSMRDEWGVESALNRWLLVGERLGTRSASATLAECAHADALLFESIGEQACDPRVVCREGSSEQEGDFAIYDHIAHEMEKLRLPVRYVATFRVDAASGLVVFSLTAPDAQMMPAQRWEDSLDAWVDEDDVSRARCARRYAIRLGMLLAAMAFSSSERVERVAVSAYYLPEKRLDATTSLDSDNPLADGQKAAYRVLFDRERFCADTSYETSLREGPEAFFALFGGALADAGDDPSAAGIDEALEGGVCFDDAQAGDPFDMMKSLPSWKYRASVPEVDEVPLPESRVLAPLSHSSADMRIHYDAARRAEIARLAEDVVRRQTAADQIAAVRVMQERASDERDAVACNRLMCALVEGSVDTTDQNAVMSCYFGEDALKSAWMRAQSANEDEIPQAIEELRRAILEEDATGRCLDTETTSYRVFDSYVSRLIYNVMHAYREDEPFCSLAVSRRFGTLRRQTHLAPDALYYCCLELSDLLSRSFEGVEEAMQYAERCVRMAPTIALGYRRLARAQMLIGEMDLSRETLHECLEICIRPEDIAAAYYQLAYVEWKSGNPSLGAAIYLASIMADEAMRLQAAAELQGLMVEERVTLPSRERIPDTLREAGVPIAPADSLLDVVGQGITEALDAGMLAVARPLVAAYMAHRPDDALANILRAVRS